MVTCAVCGETRDEPPISWTMTAEGAGQARRTVFYCERCSREHLRSIEAGLDPDYW